MSLLPMHIKKTGSNETHKNVLFFSRTFIPKGRSPFDSMYWSHVILVNMNIDIDIFLFWAVFHNCGTSLNEFQKKVIY